MIQSLFNILLGLLIAFAILASWILGLAASVQTYKTLHAGIFTRKILIEKSESIIQIDIQPRFSCRVFIIWTIWNIGVSCFYVPGFVSRYSSNYLNSVDVYLLFSLMSINHTLLWDAYLSTKWKITPIEAVINYQILGFRWSRSIRYITGLIYFPGRVTSGKDGGEWIAPRLWIETDRYRRHRFWLSEEEIKPIIELLSPWFGSPIEDKSRYS